MIAETLPEGSQEQINDDGFEDIIAGGGFTKQERELAAAGEESLRENDEPAPDYPYGFFSRVEHIAGPGGVMTDATGDTGGDTTDPWKG